MNHEIYLGRPYTSDAQSVNIPVKAPILAGEAIKADGTNPVEGESIYGITGEVSLAIHDGSFIQTVWVAGHIYAVNPKVKISNAHIVENLKQATRLGADGNTETVKDAVIIKL